MRRERERVLAMNSNLEIVSVTRYFGSIYRKFRDVRLELSNIGCLFVRYLEKLGVSKSEEKEY